MAFVVFTEFMNLGVTVVAGCHAVCRAGRLDLIIFYFAIGQALILEPRLEKAAAAAAAVIVGLIGRHVNEIFFAHDGFNDKAQILGNRIAIAFADDLAGILNRKFDLQVFVPVGVDLQFAFPDPFCVVFINVFYDEAVRDVEFFQSCQD
jgi:hypothetical protein